MCLNSALKQSEQIDRFVENGMPKKIVKTVKYTLKKRAEELAASTRISTIANSPMGAGSSTSSDEEFVNMADVLPKLRDKSLPGSSGIRTCPFTQRQVTDSTKMPDLYQRLRLLNQQQRLNEPISNIDHNINNLSKLENSVKTSTANGYVDILSVGTQWTKQIADQIQCSMGKLQKSRTYTLLTKTTQPAHIIAICILSFVLCIVGPELWDGNKSPNVGRTNDNSSNNKHENAGTNTLAILAYLGAFATHFGAQIWMTFVSGLSLYFSLPRHTFGQCQQILFPKYFALNGMLSISMLIIYVKYFCSNWSNLNDCIQITSLAVTALIEIVVRLYLAPPMLSLMHEKYKIEDTVGSGQEVGSIVQGDLVQCPHYQRIHKSFRRIHMTIAMGNMTVLMATCLHLYFLASKIQIA